MIIPNSFIKLDYEPSSDILCIEWPSTLHSGSSLFNETWDEVISTVRHYDIKRLLVDSRKLVVNALGNEYKAMVVGFGEKLKGTRLEKLARVETQDGQREQKVRELVIKDASHIDLESFNSVEEALHWLSMPEKELTE